MSLFSDIDALLAARGALSGSVTPELRALDVKYFADSQTLYLRFYYDGEATEERVDIWECVITEASAAFGPDCDLDAAIIRLDYPQKIPRQGRYAYLRKEPVILEPEHRFEGHLMVQREFVHFQDELGQFISPTDESVHTTRWGIAHIHEGKSIFPAKPETYLIPVLPIAYAQLSLQRALLGAVIPGLVLVIADVKDSLLYIRMYYEGNVGKTILQEWELVMTKALADFGPDYVLDGQIESIVYPNPIPVRGRYVYARREMRGEGFFWPSVFIG